MKKPKTRELESIFSRKQIEVLELKNIITNDKFTRWAQRKLKRAEESVN